MKFSIIIPVYNVEKYIIKCLESVYHQSYKNFEVIIVNDGSPDNSEKIIREYIENKENFIYYKKENGGLSDARNYGISKAKGDYLILIDSDDYIENNLLENINNVLKKEKYDLIRYNLEIVNEEGKILRNCEKLPNTATKSISLNLILNHEFVEPAWIYAYNLKFWKKNNFKYPYGKIHEDFGLTPIILSKAESIRIIDYKGYNYVQRQSSIMNQLSYEKLQKRTNDFVEEYLNNVKNITRDSLDNKKILNYCTGAVIYKLRELSAADCEKILIKLKKEKFLKSYSPTTIKESIIKLYYSICLKHIIKKNRLKKESKE